MKIFVKVKTNAKENRIEAMGNNQFSVRVKARPKQGEANQAVIEALAGYFDVSKSCVMLLKGHTCRQKTFLIRDSS
jgi:uncharacterized protein (TIGR00251 family)